MKENKDVQYVFRCLFDQSSLSRCFLSPTAVKALAGDCCPVAPCSSCLSKAALAADCLISSCKNEYLFAKSAG